MKAGKRYAVFSITEHKNGTTIWTRVGEAFVQPDDSMNLNLHALPLHGKLHVREAGPAQGAIAQQRQDEETRQESQRPRIAPVEDVDPAKLSNVGKLVKAVRFVKHAHTVKEGPGNGGSKAKSYTVSEQTFNELMEALEGVEQGAFGINLKGGSAE